MEINVNQRNISRLYAPHIGIIYHEFFTLSWMFCKLYYFSESNYRDYSPNVGYRVFARDPSYHQR